MSRFILNRVTIEFGALIFNENSKERILYLKKTCMSKNYPVGIIHIESVSKNRDEQNEVGFNFEVKKEFSGESDCEEYIKKEVKALREKLPELPGMERRELSFQRGLTQIIHQLDNQYLEPSEEGFLQKLILGFQELKEGTIESFRIISLSLDEQNNFSAISIDFSNSSKIRWIANLAEWFKPSENHINCNRLKTDNLHDWTIGEDTNAELNVLFDNFRPSSSLASWCALNSHIEKNEIHAWIKSIAHVGMALYNRVIPECKKYDSAFLPPRDYLIFDEENPWISPVENVRTASCILVTNSGVSVIRLKASGDEAKIKDGNTDAKLFVFSSTDSTSLVRSLEGFKEDLLNFSNQDLPRLAKELSCQPYGNCRAAIVAFNKDDLDKKISKVLTGISKREKPSSRFRPGMTWNTSGELSPKIAGIFPGQGSQRIQMMKTLCMRFPQVRNWFDRMESALVQVNGVLPSLTLFPPAEGLNKTQIQDLNQNLQSQEGGNPAVIVSSMALNELLNSLGCHPDILVGHSSGEISALVISESIEFANRDELFDAILSVNKKGAQGDLRGEIPKGKFLAVTSPDEAVMESFIEKHEGSVYLAMDNCPQQKVLFFLEQHFDELRDELIGLGVICFPLYFDRAYHTELFEVEMPSIREVYDTFVLSPPKIPVLNCIRLEDFPNRAEAIKEMAELNWTNCVQFKDACKQLHERGVRLFLEIGPSGVLSGFVNNTLQDLPHKALSLDQEGTDSYTTLLNVLAALFTEGVDLNLEILFGLQDKDMSAKEQKNETIKHLNLSESNMTRPLIPSARQDIKAMILEQHFAFMNEFLEMQTNIFNAVQNSNKTTQIIQSQHNGNSEATVERSVLDLPMIDSIDYQDASKCMSRRTISRKNDLFLQHHTLGRFILKEPKDARPLPVVPLAMNIEMMAEAASLMAPSHYSVSEITDLKATRWMTIDDDTLPLLMQAELISESIDKGTIVRVKVIKEDEPDLPYCFCTVTLQSQYPIAPKPTEIIAEKPNSTLWDAESFFEHCLFHGEAFSSMDGLLRLGEESIEVQLSIPENDGLFKEMKTPDFKIPAQVLDVPGHAIAWWEVEFGDKLFGIFPISIEKISFYKKPLAPSSKAIGRGKNKKIDAILESNFEILNLDGSLHTKITGFKFIYYRFEDSFLKSHYWTGPNTYYSKEFNVPNPNVIAFQADSLKNNFFQQSGGLWLRSLVHMFCNTREKEQWDNLTEKGRRREEWLLGRIAAKEIVRLWAFNMHSVYVLSPDIEISSDKRGRPFVVCEELKALGCLPDISITHSSTRAIAVASNPGLRVGIDLEYFPDSDKNNSPEAQKRLEIAFSEEELSFIENKGGGNLYEFVCAKEAASKAVGIGFLGNMKLWEIKNYSEAAVEVEILGKVIQVTIQRASDQIIASCTIPESQAFEIINETEVAQTAV